MAQVAAPLQRYIDALARRDFAGLGSLFDSNVQFRALIPPGFREGHDASETVGYLQRWFGEADQIEVLWSRVAGVGELSSASYKLRVHEDGVWYEVAQQLFCTIEDGKITSADLLCSGFHRALD
jgi:ketosteroid isomerase-like protein